MQLKGGFKIIKMFFFQAFSQRKRLKKKEWNTAVPTATNPAPKIPAGDANLSSTVTKIVNEMTGQITNNHAVKKLTIQSFLRLPNAQLLTMIAIANS